MINNVRNTVLTILNKENRGYLTPEQFNSYARYAQQNIFNQYFSEYTNMVAMKNARRLSSDYGDRVRELQASIERFTTVVTLSKVGDSYPKPIDLFKPLSLRYNGKVIDEVSVSKEMYLDAANLSGPSELYPVFVDKNNKYFIKPSTLTGAAELVYVRTPSEPKWTYVMVADNPIFNPSALDYQDFELGADDEVALVLEICKLAGVTIREAEITQAAIGLDNQNIQKDK
jgi:hypothetical protein